MQFIIYSKDNCPNCEKAKALVMGAGHTPQIKKLGEDISREAFFARFSNAKTLPQIELNGEHIGGFSQLEQTMAEKKLHFDNDDF